MRVSVGLEVLGAVELGGGGGLEVMGVGWKVG